MTPQQTARMIDSVLDSLERERDLLIAGDYGTLAVEAQARLEQMQRLDALPATALPSLAEPLDRLRRAAQRNETLLRAAIDGAAAGRRRLEEILKAQTRLLSYNAAGAPVERMANPALGRKV
jgi:flagellar biosynthesis/type III secretory pathway chaperone